jgi:hypothetical protein
MSNQIIKCMWTEGKLWDGSHSIFYLLFFLFPQIYKLSIYHLHLPSCALASYHPLLTTWTSKFDRTPSETRLPPEDRRNTDKRASQLRQDAKQFNCQKREREEEKARGVHPIPTATGHRGKRGIFSLSFCLRFRIPRGR